MTINRMELLSFIDSNTYNKSPRFYQIKSEYDNIICQYGFSDDYDENDSNRLDKLISLLEEEARFCNNNLPSDVFEDIDYWIEKQNFLSKGFIAFVESKIGKKNIKIEKTIEKENKITKEINSINVDIVSLLGYSNGSGITRMLNSCSSDRKNEFLRLKPYNIVDRDIAIEILNAILPIASKDKISIIKKSLEVM